MVLCIDVVRESTVGGEKVEGDVFCPSAPVRCIDHSQKANLGSRQFIGC